MSGERESFFLESAKKEREKKEGEKKNEEKTFTFLHFQFQSFVLFSRTAVFDLAGSLASR